MGAPLAADNSPAAAMGATVPLTRLCITPEGRLQFFASKLLDVPNVHFVARQWYHLVVAWQKRRFSSPEATVYVDGEAVWTGSVPPMQSTVPIEQVNIAFGERAALDDDASPFLR